MVLLQVGAELYDLQQSLTTSTSSVTSLTAALNDTEQVMFQQFVCRVDTG